MDVRPEPAAARPLALAGELIVESGHQAGARRTLEQQESQLAAHLEEKRRKLLQLTEQAQAARELLQQERANYQEHVNHVTHDLSAAQRDMVEGQQKIQAERQRLGDLRRKLEQR